MSRWPLLLTLLAAPVAAAPPSDLKNPFQPAPAATRTGDPAADLRDPSTREPAPADLRDPFTRDPAPAADLRDPFARDPAPRDPPADPFSATPAPAPAEPVVQRPRSLPSSDLKDPWSSARTTTGDLRNPFAPRTRPAKPTRGGDLRDPWAPKTQRPRRPR